MAELIKLAKMVGVIHEADNAYSIQSTWCWLSARKKLKEQKAIDNCF